MNSFKTVSLPTFTSSSFAYVIRIEKRFFSSFGKNNRLGTAWSLAGAQLFLVEKLTPSFNELIKTEEILTAKGIKFERMVLSLSFGEQSK